MPGSIVGLAKGMSKVSRACVQPWLGVPFYRQVSHFFCKLVLCRMFFQTFSGNGSEGFGGFG